MVHWKFKGDGDVSHLGHSEKHLRQAMLGYGVIDEVVAASSDLFGDATALQIFKETWLAHWRAMGCVDDGVSETRPSAAVGDEEGEEGEDAFSNADNHSSITTYAVGVSNQKRARRRGCWALSDDEDEDEEEEGEGEEGDRPGNGSDSHDKDDDGKDAPAVMLSQNASAMRRAIASLRKHSPFLATLNGEAPSDDSTTPLLLDLSTTAGVLPAPTMAQPSIKLLGKKLYPAPPVVDTKLDDLAKIAANPAALGAQRSVRKSAPTVPLEGTTPVAPSAASTTLIRAASLRVVVSRELYAKYLGFPFHGLLLLYLPNSCAPYRRTHPPPSLEPYTYRTGRVIALHYNDVESELHQLESVSMRDVEDGRECLITWPPGTVTLPSEGTEGGPSEDLPVVKHRDVTFQEFLVMYKETFSSDPLAKCSDDTTNTSNDGHTNDDGDTSYEGNTRNKTVTGSSGNGSASHTTSYMSLASKERGSTSKGNNVETGEEKEKEKERERGIGSSDLFIHDHLQAAITTFSSNRKPSKRKGRKDWSEKGVVEREERSGRDSASSAVMALLDSSDEDESDGDSGDDGEAGEGEGGDDGDDGNDDHNSSGSASTNRETERKRESTSTHARLQQLLRECNAAGGEIDANYMAEYVDRCARNISIRWAEALGTAYSRTLHAHLNTGDKSGDDGEDGGSSTSDGGNNGSSLARGGGERSIACSGTSNNRSAGGNGDSAGTGASERARIAGDIKLIKDLMTLSPFEMGLLQRRLVEAEHYFQSLFPLPVTSRQGLDHTSVYKEPPHPMAEYTLDPRKPGPPSSALQLHRKYTPGSAPNGDDSDGLPPDDLYGDRYPGTALASTSDVHASMKEIAGSYKKPRLRMVNRLGENEIQPWYNKVHRDSGRYKDRYLLESERLDRERHGKRSNERRSFTESALRSKRKDRRMERRKPLDVTAQALRLIEMGGDGDVLDMDIEGEGEGGDGGDGGDGDDGDDDGDGGDHNHYGGSSSKREESRYQALLAKERRALLCTPLHPQEEPLPLPLDGDSAGAGPGGPQVTLIGVASRMKMKLNHAYHIHLTDVVMHDHRRREGGASGISATNGNGNGDSAGNGSTGDGDGARISLPAMVVPRVSLKLNPTGWHL